MAAAGPVIPGSSFLRHLVPEVPRVAPRAAAAGMAVGGMAVRGMALGTATPAERAVPTMDLAETYDATGRLRGVWHDRTPEAADHRTTAPPPIADVGARNAQISALETSDFLPEAGLCYGHLVGYRVWSLDPAGRLVAIGEGARQAPLYGLWPRGGAVRATCDHPDHQAPARDCRCGYNTYRDAARAAAVARERSASQALVVWGKVALWGRVIEHEQGYRAAFAYPLALEVAGAPGAALEVAGAPGAALDRAAVTLALGYGVEVVTRAVTHGWTLPAFATD